MNNGKLAPHFYLYVLVFILLVILVWDIESNSITGNITKDVEKYYPIGKSYTESGVYLWNPSEDVVKDIKIDADIFGTGDVVVSLIKGGKSFVLLKRTVENKAVNVENYVELPEGTDIGLTLNYGNGNWDEDNDGLASYNDGIDYELKPIFFSNLDPDSLCTLWDVYSFDTEQFNSVCYGNSLCCSFLGLTSSVDDWDEDYILVKGNQGATDKNIVLSRIVYYNITHNSYSNYDGLTGVFAGEAELQKYQGGDFVFNSNNYLIHVELGEDAILQLKGISYVTQEDIPEVTPEVNTNTSFDIEEPEVTIQNEVFEKTSDGYHFMKNSINDSFEIKLDEGYVQKIMVFPPYYVDNFEVNIASVTENDTQKLTFNPGWFFDSVFILKVPNELLKEKIPTITTNKGTISPIPTDSDDQYAYFRFVSELKDLQIGFKNISSDMEFKSSSPSTSPFYYLIGSVIIAVLVYVVYMYSGLLRRSLDKEKELMIKELKMVKRSKIIKKKNTKKR